MLLQEQMPTFCNPLPELEDRYGHLIEKVSHWSGDKSIIEMEKRKSLIMLENAVNHYCNDKGITGGYKKLMETMTTNADSVAFVTQKLPMIMNVYPNMISKDLVSVQPMSQPTMKIFYQDVKRDDGSSLSDAIHANRNYSNNVEYNESSPTAIKEIELGITSASIDAIEKKLKARWTVESEQDIMVYHGVNVGNTLSNSLSSNIVWEWDRIILQDMLDSATGGSATFDQTEPAGLTYSDRKFWMETFFEAANSVDGQIFKKRYRKTNFMVVPADIATFIEDMDSFKADSVSIDQKVIATGGRYFSGTLKNRWRVYVDPFFPSNKVLMGYNNPGNWTETSYIWAPYILQYFSDVFLDPETFKKVRSLLSRSAYKAVVPNLLGTITITGS